MVLGCSSNWTACLNSARAPGLKCFGYFGRPPANCEGLSGVPCGTVPCSKCWRIVFAGRGIWSLSKRQRPASPRVKPDAVLRWRHHKERRRTGKLFAARGPGADESELAKKASAAHIRISESLRSLVNGSDLGEHFGRVLR